MTEKFNKKQIEEMLNNSTEEIFEDSSDIIDKFSNIRNINNVIE